MRTSTQENSRYRIQYIFLGLVGSADSDLGHLIGLETLLVDGNHYFFVQRFLVVGKTI